jgi:hypothetical protein
MTPEERKKYNREKMMEWRRRKSPLKYNKVWLKNMSLEQQREYTRNKMRESRKRKYELRLKTLRDNII